LAERERAVAESRERCDVLSSERRQAADELAGLQVDLYLYHFFSSMKTLSIFVPVDFFNLLFVLMSCC